MKLRWFWILMVLGGVACGDDESSEGDLNSENSNLVVNNTAGSTNNQSSDENNTSSTNNVTNNQDNFNTATSNDTNNTTTNNANNSNSSNNSGTTNTATNNEVGAANCMEIMQCLLVCNTGDLECQDACKANGSDDAQVKIGAYLGCVDTLCAEATGVTELTECVLANCGAEQDACLEG